MRHARAHYEGRARGRKEGETRRRSLINAGARGKRVAHLRFVPCALWTNNKILVKHESREPFS